MTIWLDDRLAAQVRREAAARSVSINAFIETTLDVALKRRTLAEPLGPFQLVTVAGRGPRPGIDLDRPRAIEAADDEVRFMHPGS